MSLSPGFSLRDCFTVMAEKRKADESEVAEEVPAKRGRGRPKKDPSKKVAKPEPATSASGEKRGRGRPKGTAKPKKPVCYFNSTLNNSCMFF